jgi:hypothetical protein
MRNLLVAVTLPLAAAGACNDHGKEMVMKLPAMIFALVLTGIAMPSAFARLRIRPLRWKAARSRALPPTSRE